MLYVCDKMYVILKRFRIPVPCVDPERFFKRGSTLPTIVIYLSDKGERTQVPLKAEHHWPASETPFKMVFCWRPIMAQH